MVGVWAGCLGLRGGVWWNVFLNRKERRERKEWRVACATKARTYGAPAARWPAVRGYPRVRITASRREYHPAGTPAYRSVRGESISIATKVREDRQVKLSFARAAFLLGRINFVDWCAFVVQLFGCGQRLLYVLLWPIWTRRGGLSRLRSHPG